MTEPVTTPAGTWVPECAEDELLVAFASVKRGFHASAVGLDPGGFPVLHHLAAKGQCRSGHLAEALGLDASTVSRHVRALVDDGLVQATRDPRDGRATVLSITDEGKVVLAEALRRHRNRLRVAVSGFTEQEKAELIRLLRKLAVTLTDQRETP